MIMGKDVPKIETIYVIVWRFIIAMKNAIGTLMIIIFCFIYIQAIQ